jgi:hypothetical protein
MGFNSAFKGLIFPFSYAMCWFGLVVATNADYLPVEHELTCGHSLFSARYEGNFM